MIVCTCDRCGETIPQGSSGYKYYVMVKTVAGEEVLGNPLVEVHFCPPCQEAWMRQVDLMAAEYIGVKSVTGWKEREGMRGKRER